MAEAKKITNVYDLDEKSRREMKVKLERVAVEGVEPLVGISVPRDSFMEHVHFDHEQQAIYLDVDAARIAVAESNGTLRVAKDSRVTLKGDFDGNLPAQPQQEQKQEQQAESNPDAKASN